MIRLSLRSLIRFAFTRQIEVTTIDEIGQGATIRRTFRLPARGAGDTLNQRRQWTMKEKILVALGQKWGRR